MASLPGSASLLWCCISTMSSSVDILPAVNGEDSRQSRFLLHSDEAPQALLPQCPWVDSHRTTLTWQPQSATPYCWPLQARW
jgi:hypothetical protein